MIENHGFRWIIQARETSVFRPAGFPAGKRGGVETLPRPSLTRAFRPGFVLAVLLLSLILKSPPALADDSMTSGGDAALIQLQQQEAQMKVNKIINNPLIQGYLKVFSNPEFIRQVEQVIKHPNRQMIFFVEAGWFILFLMFRAWCAVKITHWFIGFIIRSIATLGYMAIGSVLVPWFFIGTPYSKMLTTLRELPIWP